MHRHDQWLIVCALCQLALELSDDIRGSKPEGEAQKFQAGHISLSNQKRAKPTVDLQLGADFFWKD